MSSRRELIAALILANCWFAAAQVRADFLHTGYRNASIVRIDEVTGQPGGEFATLGDGFESFGGMTLGPDGLLYVSAFNHNVSQYGRWGVYRFNPRSGQFINTFISDSILIDGEFGPNGSYFAVSTWTRDLREFDGSTGAFKRVVLPVPNSYYGVSAITFNRDGDLFAVTDAAKLARYDAASGVQTGPTTDLSSLGLAGYRFDALAIGPDGDLYATYNYQYRDTHLPGGVMKFDGTTGGLVGTLIDDIPAFGAAAGGGLGLAFGPDGDLYVGSQNAQAIFRYDPATWQKVRQYSMTGFVEGAEFIQFLPVPEPATACLLASGLLGAAGIVRRRPRW